MHFPWDPDRTGAALPARWGLDTGPAASKKQPYGGPFPGPVGGPLPAGPAGLVRLGGVSGATLSPAVHLPVDLRPRMPKSFDGTPVTLWFAPTRDAFRTLRRLHLGAPTSAEAAAAYEQALAPVLASLVAMPADDLPAALTDLLGVAAEGGSFDGLSGALLTGLAGLDDDAAGIVADALDQWGGSRRRLDDRR